MHSTIPMLQLIDSQLWNPNYKQDRENSSDQTDFMTQASISKNILKKRIRDDSELASK